MTKKRKEINTPDLRKNSSFYKKFYYVVFGVFALIFFIALFISRGYMAKCILFINNTDTFMDHFNSVIYNEIDPYENSVLYPPLACLFYKICNILVPRDVYGAFVKDPTLKAQPSYVKIQQGFLFPFLIFFIAMALLLLFAINNLKKGKPFEKILFIGTVCFSAPMLFALERGNNLLIPLAFSMLFVAWQDSENKLKRELGFIALAIAVGFKLYPALFAVVLLSEKRWREFFRVVLYCVITTILPFFFFYNGFESIAQMIHSIIGFSDKRGSNLLNYETCLDFKHIFVFVFSYTYRFTHIDLTMEELDLAANIFRYIMTFGCALASLLVKEKWKKYMFAACIIYGFPGSVSTYLLLFFTIPIILLIDSEGKPKFTSTVYLALLVLTQVPTILPHYGEINRYMSGKISSLTVAAICGLAYVELLVLLIKFIASKTRRGKSKDETSLAKEAVTVGQ